MPKKRGVVMFFLKLHTAVWPFIRELILGQGFLTSLFRGIRKPILIIIVVLSVGLNAFLLDRLMSVTHRFMLMKIKFDKLLENPPPLVETVKTTKPADPNDTYSKIRDGMIKMSNRTITSCPRYDPPVLPPVPEMPLDKLNKIKQGDYVALNEIQYAHIKLLYEYITTTQRAMRIAADVYSTEYTTEVNDRLRSLANTSGDVRAMDKAKEKK